MRLSWMNLALISASLASASNARAAAASLPDLVRAPVDTVFVPEGFDDNDDVEVIVHGDFPNSCYKMGPVRATVDEPTKSITLDVRAYLYHDQACQQVLIPFIASVHVGLLSPGVYKTAVLEGPAAKTPKLAVTHTDSPGPDSFLYAPVDHIDLVSTGGQQVIEMAGTYPYMFIGCMRLKEVRTRLSADNVLVILPIAELINDERCTTMTDHHFKAVQKLDQPLGFGQYLMHARVLQGGSVNQFVDLRQ